MALQKFWICLRKCEWPGTLQALPSTLGTDRRSVRQTHIQNATAVKACSTLTVCSTEVLLGPPA